MTDRELMQMAIDALEQPSPIGGFDNQAYVAKALRNRLAQPEPEPAFYVIQATDRFGEGYEQTYWEDPLGFPVYTRPVHAIDISQERVDETAKHEHEFFCPRCGHCCQQREWVGLTDEEIEAALKSCNTVDTYKYFRAVEAKLKEKNI